MTGKPPARSSVNPPRMDAMWGYDTRIWSLREPMTGVLPAESSVNNPEWIHAGIAFTQCGDQKIIKPPGQCGMFLAVSSF